MAGSLAAFSSALSMRSSRYSEDRTRSERASGVPYFSVCARVFTRPRIDAMSTRAARLASAWDRSGRKPSSTAARPNSSASSGAERRISAETRSREASRVNPASAQMTMRSRASGNPFWMLLRRVAMTLATNSSGA